MARTGRVNHTHQYYRHSNGIWYCSGIDGCSHFVPKNMPEPVGRKSICWGAGEPHEFVLLPDNMKDDKPRCDECQMKSEVTNEFLKKYGLDEDDDPITRMMRKVTEKTIKSPAPVQTKPSVKPPADEVEVEYVHSPDCRSFLDEDCDCM